MHLPQQTKKTSQQNSFTHYQRLMMSVGKTKIGLHQFNNYLSQVKIIVTTQQLTTADSCHTRDIWRVLHLSAGQCPDTECVRQSAFLPVI